MKTLTVLGVSLIILTTLLINLKLIGGITWSWFWVLFPIIIPLFIWAIIEGIGLIYVIYYKITSN